GGFVVLDGESFELKGNWENECETPLTGHDFWYQARHNVLVSSAGMVPKVAGRGFSPDDFKKGGDTRPAPTPGPSPRLAGLGAPEGRSPRLGVPVQRDNWAVEEVIRIPAKDVSGWIMPKMPAFIADLIISPDDRFLYVCNWLHGDIRQYELSRSCKPRLVGQVRGSPWPGRGRAGPGDARVPARALQVFVGGSILRGGPVSVCRDEELKGQPEPLVVKPPLSPRREGSVMLQLDVDTDKGGLAVNKNFLVDFGKEPHGPCLAHEIRFPGGDCKS
ncbi:SBP1 oxidase, partial [Tichodroma muraria]|nr:SBP1 oxidase [Tichodroma muraria]